MQRAGTVVGSAQGLLVVRCADADHPTVGTALVDESLTDAGEVVEVFGPVERPYVAVSPAEGVGAAGLLWDPLYAR